MFLLEVTALLKLIQKSSITKSNMKNVAVLYAADISEHAFEKVFNGKSAFDLVLEWSKNIPDCACTAIFSSSENEGKIKSSVSDNVKIIAKEKWSKGSFISAVSKNLGEEEADYAVITYADTPFLNAELTQEICRTHEKYKAEYTFQDGYPYGLAPETLDKGACAIIAALLENNHKGKYEEEMSRDAVFSLLSLDINSFEIETVIAEKDYRLLRLEFECSSKINFNACRAVFTDFNKSEGLISFCDRASSLLPALKTVPAFYNVQISGRYNHALCYVPEEFAPAFDKEGAEDMSFSDFKVFIEKASLFSEKAVVSLSAFGEPLLNKDFELFVRETLKYKNLSLLIETDGTLLTEEMAKKLSEIENAADRINWVIFIDAMDKTLYSKIHNCPETDFDKALDGVSILERYFPRRVYPQMVRMKINEPSLESFFRFWKEPSSPSAGKFIIQKYNNFCTLLSDEKPADLSPLERNPCWHLRRDMTVLCDGSAAPCVNQFNQKEKAVGNVFTDNLEDVWRKFDETLESQIEKKYLGLCRACDEHYTFNF